MSTQYKMVKLITWIGISNPKVRTMNVNVLSFHVNDMAEENISNNFLKKDEVGFFLYNSFKYLSFRKHSDNRWLFT